MAATYDGLAVSFAAWAGVSILATFPEVAATPIPREWGWALLLGFLLMSIAALRQGANYYRYQIQDLVAAFSAATSPMMPIE